MLPADPLPGCVEARRVRRRDRIAVPPESPADHQRRKRWIEGAPALARDPQGIGQHVGGHVVYGHRRVGVVETVEAREVARGTEHAQRALDGLEVFGDHSLQPG